jgi:Fe-S cluster assembly protein SufD
MSAATRPEPATPYAAAFAAVGATCGPEAAARSAAFERFAALGFPGPRDEAWKYTSLRRLQSRSFHPANDEDATDAGRHAPSIGAGPVVTLTNGRIGTAPAVPAGFAIRTLERALADGDATSTLLRVPSGGGTERFAALNSALCRDVLVVDIADHVTVDEPLQLRIEARGDATMNHPRLLIRAGCGSAARIVLHHTGDDAGERFVNSVVEIESAADSRLHLYRLQSAGARSFLIERIEATLAQRAFLAVHDAALGASLARLDLNVRLAAPGASAELTGLFLADGTRHLDTHVHVDHLAPDTRSLVDYRGVAAGRGRGVFDGLAVVHVAAQKSRARQVSRNLLLTPGAEIDTRPELEIYADDVQCSHGATTGQLDPAALFYLRSRGLGEIEARSALTRAFAGAVLSRIDLSAFADSVHAALDDRLAGLLAVTQ